MALLANFKKLFKSTLPNQYSISDPNLPSVSIFVAAYNEEDCIEKKILNCLEQNYPKDKISYYFVSDGSDDQTASIINSYKEIHAFHKAERKGKIAAVQRVVPNVNTEIVVFTDANALLNNDAVFNLVRHFKDKNTGAVAGEKRIKSENSMAASGAGEGIYWQYESFLKKCESDFNTVVGAAGELFAIRTKLYENIQTDTLVEDFQMTMKIASKGYHVVYDAEAFAIEGPSKNIREEFKRKKRIAAGGWQSAYRLFYLLNPIKYGLLSFQFFSHRIMRWTLAPFSIPLLFAVNIYLLNSEKDYFKWIFIIQCLFYLFALIGWFIERNKLSFKLFFVPFYFCFMNYAVFAGLYSLLSGKQSVVWEKAGRK